MSLHFLTRRRLALFMLLATVGFHVYPGIQSVANADPAPAPPADAQIFRRESLPDPVAGTDAFSILVPDGWKVEGHARWNLMSSRVVDIDATVYDPKSGAALVIYPELWYLDREGERKKVYHDYVSTLGPAKVQQLIDQGRGKEGVPGQIDHAQAASPGDYVRHAILPLFRKDIPANYTFTAETDLPELVKARTQIATDEAKNAAGVLAKIPTFTASRFRISYTLGNGAPFEEEFACLLVTLPVDDAKLQVFWQAEVWSCRAPAGQLDSMMPLYATLKSSFAHPFPWQFFHSKCVYLWQQNWMNQQWIDFNQRQNAARQASADAAEAERRQFADHMAAKEAAHHQEMNYIQNRKDFVSPGSSTTYTLSASYSHNWVSNKGEILSTNDARFDPRGNSPDTSWTQLEAAK